MSSLQESSNDSLTHIQNASGNWQSDGKHQNPSEEQAKGVGEVNQAIADRETPDSGKRNFGFEQNSAASHSMANDTSSLTRLLKAFQVARKDSDKGEEGDDRYRGLCGVEQWPMNRRPRRA
ncbi:MAG: hypothetical protein Ct9H300mP14_06640 [Gammaproteobacteria bacterium]|nr:MAG: hypothetical protein Ct9H300mP14_06640 [Gammaproteobacteria bacterium]